jgi:hypothetical protein
VFFQNISVHRRTRKSAVKEVEIGACHFSVQANKLKFHSKLFQYHFSDKSSSRDQLNNNNDNNSKYDDDSQQGQMGSKQNICLLWRWNFIVVMIEKFCIT